MNTLRNRAIQVALLVGLVMAVAADAKSADRDEVALIAVLQSAAAPSEKAIACKKLAVCGSKAAVPALVSLLTDEKLAAWARIGLEAIPDPAIEEALRETMGKLQGKALVGVINSLARRGDVKAVETLVAKVKDADPEVSAAAVAALGRIGGDQAVQALGQVLASATPATLPVVCEACLRSADGLITQGKRDKAAEFCERIRGLQVARHIRMEALRSLIIARQAAGIPLLVEALKGEDTGMAAVALDLAHTLPGADLTKALTAEVDKVPADRQVCVIEALGCRLDKTVAPALLALTKSTSTNICVAAVGALMKLGDVSVLPRLVELAVSPADDISKAAQKALAEFPVPEADAAIIPMLASPDVKSRLAGADIISRRAVRSAMTAVAKAAMSDTEEEVRVACINTLRELGQLADLSALVDSLLKNKSAGESQAAEKAMATICGRQTDLAACAEKLIAGLAQAQPAQKCALLRLLRSVVDPKSLQAIRAAMSDANADVQDAATRLLCDWNTADAAPDLLALAKTSPNATYKLLSLRGYIRVSGDKNVTNAQRVTMIKEAAALVQRDEERKILLGALGNATDAESFAMAVTYLDNAALKDEACLAVVAIGEHLVKEKPDLVIPVMARVIDLSKNEKLDARAKAVAATKKG